MGPQGPVDIEPTVRVESLYVGFAGREVLHNLSAKFNRGRLAVILGRSGSGKTTFLRALNRLNERFPQSETKGSLWLNSHGRSIGHPQKMKAYGGAGFKPAPPSGLSR
jgi:ABC-type phosphate transport system ATPase subunit